MSEEGWVFRQERDPFRQLPTIAERLGVSPASLDDEPNLYLEMQDGRRYSVFALVNALLDRLDGVKP